MKYFLRIINFQIIYFDYSIDLYTRKVYKIGKLYTRKVNLYKEMEYLLRKLSKYSAL